MGVVGCREKRLRKEEEPTRLREDPHSGDEEDGVGMMTARPGDRK